MRDCDTCMYDPVDETCNYCSEEYSKWVSKGGEYEIKPNTVVIRRENHLDEGTPKYYSYTYKGIKLDPYRICEVYNIGGGPREQIIKKCLRFTDKGQEPLEVIKEIRQALDRWEEMIKENGDAM